MSEEREAILELKKIMEIAWGGDGTWQECWDRIDEIEMKWEKEDEQSK